MSLISHAYPFARKLLFTLDAELAHELTLQSLQKAERYSALRPAIASRLPRHKPATLMGLKVRNLVGLAAGLDKNAACVDGLAQLGFGFMELGTVTPRPQTGNPKPRLFRLPQAHALINRMGFNNEGLDVFVRNIRQSRWQSQGGIVGLNIGKNADTPMEQAIDDYLLCLNAVYPQADYISINVSSPNTKNLRELQDGEALDRLLSAIQQRRTELAETHGRRIPLAIKIAPDLTFEQIDGIARLVMQHQIDGIIATNTTLARTGVEGLPHANEAGGLSGPPVHAMSLRVIERLRKNLSADTTIIGVGGIESGKQAAEKIQAGANAVQIYTGLIYRGPILIKECVQAIHASR